MIRQQSQKLLTARYDAASKQATDFLKREYPHLVGILIQGSVAREQVGPFSDIDLIGVTRDRRKPAEFSYFDDDIYIPVAFRSVGELEREFKDPKQFFWARGSAKSSTRILYDPKRILWRIMTRGKKTKPSHRIIEDSIIDGYRQIIEYAGKLRNGMYRRDEYLIRYAARIIAQHAENVVIALNDISPISENIVWHQVLAAKRKPQHFRIDYPLALGIESSKNSSVVYRSALRLSRETLSLVKSWFRNKAESSRFKALLSEPLESHGL